MLKSLITIIGNSFVKNTCKKQVLEYMDKSTETEEHHDEYVNKVENDPTLGFLNDMIRKDLCKGLAHKKYNMVADPERRRLQLLNARRTYHRNHKNDEDYKDKQNERAKNYYAENSEKIKLNRKLRYQFEKLDGNVDF